MRVAYFRSAPWWIVLLPGMVLIFPARLSAQESRPAIDSSSGAGDLSRSEPRFLVLEEPAAIERTVGTDSVQLPARLEAAAQRIRPSLRRALAGKPSPYLVKAHDVGEPTDFHIDIPWHLLDKEKDPRFKLPHFGKLGVVNTHSDVNWLIGIGVDGHPVDFNPPRRHLDHLINLNVQRIEMDGVRVTILFIMPTSDTLLACLHAENDSGQKRRLRIESVCTKPPVELKPVDRFGYGVHSTSGRLQWIGWNAANYAMVCSYEDWDEPRARPIGSLLCTLASSRSPQARRTAMEPGDGAIREAVMTFELELEAQGSDSLRLGLNLHRFAPEAFTSRVQMDLYPAETPEQARFSGISRCVSALQCDWPSLVERSYDWYTRLPLIELPRPSWAADFYCALELPRGNTWSPQEKLKQPWYTFCRVHGNEPYGWWSYGMHGHEHLSTFVVNITEPALSQSFIRGHFQNQREDGYIPYGVNHRGVNVHKGLATCPLLAWESWTAYLWNRDRAFLDEAYQAVSRYIHWWRSPARTRSGMTLQRWKDFVETVRDDGDLATWTATDKAEKQEALDLNCYLLNEERALAAMAAELGRPDKAEQWSADAEQRTAVMRRQLWHAEDGVYYGRDILGERWARVMDISLFFPMWAGLATAEQSARLVELLRDPQAFGTDYPVATLAVRHMPEHARGQHHWRGSNWVEITWLVILGLKQYGYYDEAARLAEINCRMVFDTLEKTGHFREYFNSLTGAPCDLTDYIWTSMPAAMILDVFFGVRPTAGGLEVLPAWPAGWPAMKLDNLHVRDSRISLRVRRDAAAQSTTVHLNGQSRSAIHDRGILIAWNDLPSQCAIEIVQPARIREKIVRRSQFDASR